MVFTRSRRTRCILVSVPRMFGRGCRSSMVLIGVFSAVRSVGYAGYYGLSIGEILLIAL
jgi:hypothetical protein